MSKRVLVGEVSAAINEELTVYGQKITDSVNAVGAEEMNRLVEITRATAPRGGVIRKKKKHTPFYKDIRSDVVPGTRGDRYIWHVGGQNYRLTHLIVHGHATKDGGRTKANPFLTNALAKILPEYESRVKEAIEND